MIPTLSGSLRNTTPEMKKVLKTKRHYPGLGLGNEKNDLKYLNDQNIIQCIKTKKHIQPIEQAQNTRRLRQSVSPLLTNSQLGVNLVPKIDNAPRTPQKSRVFANIFNNSCSFENVCLTQCRQCKSNNKENFEQNHTPIKMVQSIITSKGNYFKK